MKEKNRSAIPVDSDCRLFFDESNRGAGFAFANFQKGEVFIDERTGHHYIYVVLKGRLSVTCKLFDEEVIAEGQMVFIPRHCLAKFVAVQDSEIAFFAFDAPMINKDAKLLENLYSSANRKEYKFMSLPANEYLQDLFLRIRSVLSSGKCQNTEICCSWANEFFILLVTYYPLKDVVQFLRPVLSGKVENIRAFVENNYMDVGGNVSTLIKLSGLSNKTFHIRFQEEFGVTAKTWLNERLKERLVDLARKPYMTPRDLAFAIRVSTQRLCQIVRTHFDCTPVDFINRVRQENPETTETDRR